MVKYHMVTILAGGWGQGRVPGEGGQGGAPKLKCSDFHNLDVYGIPMVRPTTWYNFFLKILSISW